ncbi:MAG TPA: UDP-N-acetylmuramoyl-L-alanyl-D-glutamate--2,6-diaminopimelate ligase, partial [Methylophilaceae bacterium]|nr:UDP-N-acetylmuramoyl-L-alanyl-D-glutamate--2,6-diaminopimelate ligase [Methylophilaceae bacterium]
MTAILDMLKSSGAPIDNITSDSRKVSPGTLFLAYPGERADGRDFITEAVKQGAAAVLWEKQGFAWNPAWTVPNLSIKGLRAQAGVIADEYFDHPSSHLWMVGVTGTNGKTSCSHWMAQALNALGRKTAVLGTLGTGFPESLSEAVNTTPDPILLHRMLSQFHEQGARAVAMEVSSHGLDQGRVNGVHFDVAVFTNLSRDHLDYHGDMESYGAAKKKLFHWQGLRSAVLNADDAFGRQIERELSAQDKQVLTYGLDSGDVRGHGLRFDDSGLSMDVTTPFGEGGLRANVFGRFNAYNLLAVLSALLVSEVRLDDALTVLRSIEPVAGRMQTLGGGRCPLVVIDYAHTPDALEKALCALKEQLSANENRRGRLICVFGCGGNRDAGKRPLMGEVAAELADAVLVTSDNPRNEDPGKIIADILDGRPRDF